MTAEDEKTRIIDLKKVRFDRADADLLDSLRQSGTSERKTYASIVKLYVRMGLLLRKYEIYTIEELEKRLTQSAQHVQQVSAPQLEDIKRYIDDSVALALKRSGKKPRNK